ncbi:MAG TPA: N-acetylmuramoyl-L-alanine amidase [Flavobacterium sp.]|jgi:N-acetylmuramoyl-L-alanine amidase
MGISGKIRAFFALTFCAISLAGYSQSGKFKVTLDAGHGGKDWGAVYTGHVEKNIALSVVLKVGKILESTPGFEVNYTRKTDVFIDLIERANIANRADSHIFVSIHCNANANTTASGTETYVMGMSKNASNLEAAKKENDVIILEKDYKEKYQGYNPNSPESLIGVTLMQEEYLDNSITLASKLEDNFTTALRRNSRGVKQAPFMVLHKAYMPRVLIEMGFISNPKDGALLDSDDGQNDMAKAIADAIISYKKEYYGNGAVDVADERPSEKLAPSERTPAANTPAVATPREPVREPETVASSDSKGVIFKVQIAASGTKLALVPSNFKGLSNVSMMSDNGTFYKYMYGATSDYNEAKQNVAEAKAKGFESAYLVAFKDGKKVSVQEALK